MEDSISKEELSNIVDDLYNEFVEETIRLKTMYEDYTKKEIEMKQYIDELEKNDNTDFSFFSPRSIKVNNTDKIEQLKIELEHNTEEKEKLLSRLKYYEEKVHKLKNYNMSSTSMIMLQEMEKQRISRELHDTTVQNLTHMIHKNELCMKYIENDTTRAKLELESIHKGIKDIINDMRTTIFNLRPMSFDDLGFAGAIEHMMEVLQKSTDIKLEYHIEGDYDRISDIILISVIRIIQEACNNAIKYSKATNLIIDCKIDNQNILIMVRDNGIGIQSRDSEDLVESDGKNGFGISIMKERTKILKGSFDLLSEDQRGTTINISVPITEKGEYDANKSDHC